MKANSGLEKIMHRLAEYSQTASGAKRSVANYLATHLEEIAFFNLDQIAKSTGISASTVTRTVSEIGFKGYPGLQNEVREIVRMKLLPAERSRILSITEESQAYATSLKFDRENLEYLADLNPIEKFEQAAALLSRARCVYLCGMQSSHGPILTFGSFLSQIRTGVHVISLSDMSLSEQILEFTDQDVLMVLALPHYHAFSVGIAEDALKRGCTLISITDNAHSSLGLKSAVAFAVPYRSASFFNSHAASCSLLSALIAGIYLANKKNSQKRLTEHEELLRKWNLYEKS